MTVATTARAQFLKSAESSEVAINPTVRALWGEAAGDTAQSSVIALKADATAEASRQLALLDDTLAEDGLVLEGVYFDLEGETVRVDYSAPGGGTYFGGAALVDILVTSSIVSIEAGTTTIKGLLAL